MVIAVGRQYTGSLPVANVLQQWLSARKVYHPAAAENGYRSGVAEKRIKFPPQEILCIDKIKLYL